MAYVVIYGFGTASAHVHASAPTKEEGEVMLKIIRSVWGTRNFPHAHRFTLHLRSNVVGRNHELKDWVYHSEAPPQKPPEGVIDAGRPVAQN